MLRASEHASRHRVKLGHKGGIAGVWLGHDGVFQRAVTAVGARRAGGAEQGRQSSHKGAGIGGVAL